MTISAPPSRALMAGQQCVVHVAEIDGTVSEVWRSDTFLVEAPNWTVDGSRLVVNGNSQLWSLDLVSGQLDRIEISGCPGFNNDHVLDPGGEHIYFTATDWQIYRAPLAGGEALRVSSPATSPAGMMHFLHGVSPDATRLTFTAMFPGGENWWAKTSLYSMNADGLEVTELTAAGTPADGIEYAPDGRWLYFNTEVFDGHAQIGRMHPDGSAIEQLTFDNCVNWFPHLAPVGGAAVYLSFPPGTIGHPADFSVDLRLVTDGNWQASQTIASLPGGQGTINVNSWAPTGDRFAFVSYPSEQ